jgi:hypothetical protein
MRKRPENTMNERRRRRRRRGGTYAYALTHII